MSEKQLPEDVEVCLVDLPPAIGGAVRTYADGFTRIYINAGHGHDAQIRDMDHELSHIDHDDIHNDCEIDTAEHRAEAQPTTRAIALADIPNLKKARDLMPKQPESVAQANDPAGDVDPGPEPPLERSQLTPHQVRVLANALRVLDNHRSLDEIHTGFWD